MHVESFPRHCGHSSVPHNRRSAPTNLPQRFSLVTTQPPIHSSMKMKSAVAQGLKRKGKKIDWLERWYVCWLHCRFNYSPVRATDDSNLLQYHLAISCQSVVTSEIVKHFWSWVKLIKAALYQVNDHNPFTFKRLRCYLNKNWLIFLTSMQVPQNLPEKNFANCQRKRKIVYKLDAIPVLHKQQGHSTKDK